MIIGRVLYGVGGESLFVATSTIISIWFEGKELAFAFGIDMAVGCIGMVISNLISPAIFNSSSPSEAFWVGVAMNAFALLSGIGIRYLDRKGHTGRVMTSIRPLHYYQPPCCKMTEVTL